MLINSPYLVFTFWVTQWRSRVSSSERIFQGSDCGWIYRLTEFKVIDINFPILPTLFFSFKSSCKQISREKSLWILLSTKKCTGIITPLQITIPIWTLMCFFWDSGSLFLFGLCCCGDGIMLEWKKKRKYNYVYSIQNTWLCSCSDKITKGASF